MKRILFSAQGFGFGPAAKASIVAAALKRRNPDIILDFIGDGSAYELACTRDGVFSEVYNSNQFDQILERLRKKSYCMVVSAMEPRIVLEAHAVQCPVFLIDSLYWFWDWKAERIDQIAGIRIDSSDDVRNAFDGLHPHEHQFLGHKYADRSYLQCYFDAEKSSNNLDWIEKKAVIGPIVDKHFVQGSVHKKQNTILLTFCGQFNPLVSLKEALSYCELILLLTADGVRKFLQDSSNQLRIIGHPIISEKIPGLFEKTGFPSVPCEHLPYTKYYQAIDGACVLIGPPSLTTLYESNAYDKPYVFLPEQHDGHWPNFLKLIKQVEGTSGSMGTFPGKMLTPYLGNLNKMEEKDITKLYESILSILDNQDGDLFCALRDEYTKILTDLCQQEYRDQLRSGQKHYFDTYFHTARLGTERIVMDIEEVISS